MLSTNILSTIQADIPLSLQGLKGSNILDKFSEIRTETFEQQHWIMLQVLPKIHETSGTSWIFLVLCQTVNSLHKVGLLLFKI